MFTLALVKMKLIFKDKASIAWMIIAPILFITVIVYGFEGTDSKSHITIVDNEKSEYSTQLIDLIKSNGEYTVDISELSDAKKNIVNGTSIAVLVIPNKYSNMIMNDEWSQRIQVLKLRDNARITAIKNLVSNYYNKQKISYNIGDLALKNVESIGVKPANAEVFIDNINNKYIEDINGAVIGIDKKTMEEEVGVNELSISAIGIMIMFILFFIVNSAGMMMDERNNGIADRIKTTNISRSSVILGQTLSLLFVGGIQIMLLFLAGKYLYDINWGNSYLGLAVLAIGFLLCAASLGVLISNLAKNRRQMTSLVAIIVMTSSLLGGCMWSKDMMSDALIKISYLTPQSWVMDGITDLLSRQAGISSIFKPCSALLIFTVILLTATYFVNKFSKNVR